MFMAWLADFVWFRVCFPESVDHGPNPSNDELSRMLGPERHFFIRKKGHKKCKNGHGHSVLHVLYRSCLTIVALRNPKPTVQICYSE